MRGHVIGNSPGDKAGKARTGSDAQQRIAAAAPSSSIFALQRAVGNHVLSHALQFVIRKGPTDPGTVPKFVQDAIRRRLDGRSTLRRVLTWSHAFERTSVKFASIPMQVQ